MGVPKLSLELAPGSSLGSFALTEMLASPRIDSVSVVVRKSDSLKWIRDAQRMDGTGANLRIITCEHAALGMSYSLREGLRDALSVNPQAIIVVLADQPFITSRLLDRLAAAFFEQPEMDYVACAGENIALPPALFAPSMFGALSRLEGDGGARKLLASPEYRGALVPATSADVFTDIDTPNELKNARQYWRSLSRRGGCGDEPNGFDGDAADLQAIRTGSRE